MGSFLKVITPLTRAEPSGAPIEQVRFMAKAARTANGDTRTRIFCTPAGDPIEVAEAHLEKYGGVVDDKAVSRAVESSGHAYIEEVTYREDGEGKHSVDTFRHYPLSTWMDRLLQFVTKHVGEPLGLDSYVVHGAFATIAALHTQEPRGGWLTQYMSFVRAFLETYGIVSDIDVAEIRPDGFHEYRGAYSDAVVGELFGVEVYYDMIRLREYIPSHDLSMNGLYIVVKDGRAEMHGHEGLLHSLKFSREIVINPERETSATTLSRALGYAALLDLNIPPGSGVGVNLEHLASGGGSDSANFSCFKLRCRQHYFLNKYNFSGVIPATPLPPHVTERDASWFLTGAEGQAHTLPLYRG
jgi:hypothetical protein